MTLKTHLDFTIEELKMMYLSLENRGDCFEDEEISKRYYELADAIRNCKNELNKGADMGKLKMTEEGYIFVSASGIEYDLLEGSTINGDKPYSSDILFVMFTRYDCESDMVYWMYGAEFVKDEDNVKIISEKVNKWESEHEDLVQGIKDGTINQF